MSRHAARLGAILVVVAQIVAGPALVEAAPADYPLPNGHFYTQANGAGGAGGTGYAVVDANERVPSFGLVFLPFDSAFRAYGGVASLGYPASRVTVFPDFPIQVCQKLVLQYQPGRGIFFLNTFDLLHERGFDAYLDSVRSIPPPFSTAPDTGLAWPAVVARHQAFLDQDPAIRAAYFGVSDPLKQFGLPMSYKDYGNVFVVRAQRAAFQQWRVDVGPNRAGSVTVVNGGDVGKEVNLFPASAVVPLGPPSFGANLVALLPGAGRAVHSPIVATGYARLFEAQGSYELRDAAGRVIAGGNFHAVSGTSADFARFDATIPYTVAAPQPGRLTFFSLSPATGARINVVDVPVRLE